MTEETGLYLFNRGENHHAYRDLGCHFTGGGARFAVWAPKAAAVSVTGDFNGWSADAHPMELCGATGVWQASIEGIVPGNIYKYAILHRDGPVVYKADPFGFFMQRPPDTASVAWELDGYAWGDPEWMEKRARTPSYHQPVNIYEVHAGSWKRGPDGELLSWPELAKQLIPYVKKLGFTHIELLPVQEHPFDPSWGYQVAGYFAPTARYGTPQELMGFIDLCHQNGIGVIIDWVAAHFPKDEHGLYRFDGTSTYEPTDKQLCEHPQWGTVTFDYGKSEVQSFLISNACFWMDMYHADGLRVDAVSSMLYRDYGRKEGEWTPNKNGGRENLEAIGFLQKLNAAVFARYENVLMVAEESTSFPLVSHPVYEGGLGFNYKWNMGWMNDILDYFKCDPIHRHNHHDQLLFSMWYAFSENFILPLSHDEVVHGKKSLLDKMPGDYWQKFAQLRLLLAYMYAHPGKKLLFMGGEFGQFIEWRFYDGLDWLLLDYPAHKAVQDYFAALSKLYRKTGALYEVDDGWDGFQWLNQHDKRNCVVCFARYGRKKGKKKPKLMVCVFNFLPEVRHNYRFGVPMGGMYQEVFNSDRQEYHGSSVLNPGSIASEKMACNGFADSISITVAPYAAQFFTWDEKIGDS